MTSRPKEMELWWQVTCGATKLLSLLLWLSFRCVLVFSCFFCATQRARVLLCALVRFFTRLFVCGCGVCQQRCRRKGALQLQNLEGIVRIVVQQRVFGTPPNVADPFYLRAVLKHAKGSRQRVREEREREERIVCWCGLLGVSAETTSPTSYCYVWFCTF